MGYVSNQRIELTVTVLEREGALYGIGEVGRPTNKQDNYCCSRWVFARGNVRIFVLAVAEGVTQEQAQIFAIFMYEGKGTKVNIDEVYRTGLTPISARKLATP